MGCVAAVIAETEKLMLDRNAIDRSRWPLSGDRSVCWWRARRARIKAAAAEPMEWIAHELDGLRELVTRAVAIRHKLQMLTSSGDIDHLPATPE